MRKLTVLLATAGLARAASAQADFRLEEATLAEIHAAFAGGGLTCRGLVERYLARIAAYDQNGPALNAIVAINPGARAVADSLDRRFRAAGPVGPLHCVPMIVKENFETVELPVTAGSLSLHGFVSERDAFQVRRIKAAGAIVLAKSNMAEFAFSPFETVSSILPGYTRNPYALDRVTAGSSGGTAAAVAANFGAAGLGTDTGNSIRGPSAHQALVGIRSTMGLTSRSGIVPLNLAADIAGPMARTVADVVAVFQVVVGADPADSVTRAAARQPAVDYRAALIADGLRGARIGILTQAYRTATTDPEVIAVFDRAVADLRRAGADVIDGATIDSLDAWRRNQGGSCFPFKHDLNQWLASHHGRTPVATLEEVIRSRKFHPSIESRLERAQAVALAPDQDPACATRDRFRANLRRAVLEVMDRLRLDALIYPTWSNPPRRIGDLNTPAGDNNQLFAPSTGFPAITVPMGYLRGGILPAGLQFFGRPWQESVLFRLAYGYEQATRHRRAPPATPPLVDR
jgi:Asp-tRNA(Asn)/Glu-tRNA(Gln) amidotransferase A subunit family amidase